MSADTLPPLPQPEFFWQREVHRSDRFTRIDGYTAVQMHAYARAALAAKPPDAALCHPAAALLEVPQAPRPLYFVRDIDGNYHLAEPQP